MPLDIASFDAVKSQYLGDHVRLSGFLIAKRDEKRFWSFTSMPTTLPVQDYVRIVVPPRSSRLGYSIQELPEFCTTPWEDNYRFRYLNRAVIYGRVIRDFESQEIAVEMNSINMSYSYYDVFVKEENNVSEFPLSSNTVYSLTDLRGHVDQSIEQPIRVSGHIVAMPERKQLVLMEKPFIEVYNENDGQPLSDDALLTEGVAIRSSLLYNSFVETIGLGIGPYASYEMANLIGIPVKDSSQSSIPKVTIHDISEAAIQIGEAIFHFDFSDLGVITLDRGTKLDLKVPTDSEY